MSPQSRYTILRKIADGGTAEIFLAKQTGASGFEKMVVLKRIFNTFYSDPQFRHMLIDEAHIAMSLYHSNIVQVLDLGEAGGRHFLALELVDGWTLDEVLRRSRTANVPFPPALALYVTAEVCRALAYAHSKARDGQPLGIVHRDVSPHNVLLSDHGEVKLTDFGIAKAHNKQEQSLGNMIKGKIAFMSPEQASGHDLDARSDLFSLGTILYMMIVRSAPFDAPTDYETLMQVRAGDFIPPETARPGLNPEIYRVMRKAMGKSPESRYQKADDMLVDVEQVMRLAFRAVGQTELARWLSDLSAKDGVPPLTRAPPPPVNDTVVMDRPSFEPAPASGSESGLELDLDGADAVLVAASPLDTIVSPSPAAAAPPPLPPDTQAQVTSLRPQPFWKKGFAANVVANKGARAGIVALLLVLIAAGGARWWQTGGRRRAPARTASAGGPAPMAGAGQAPAITEVSPSPAAARPASPVGAREPGAGAAAAEAVSSPADGAAVGRELAAVGTGSGADVPTPPAAAPGEEPEPTDQPQEKPGESSSGGATRAGAGKSGTKKVQVAVSIKTDPAGTEVSTRHRSFGSTPISLKLQPGSSYELTFSKAGYLSSTKVYKILPATRAIRVALKKAPPARPTQTAESPSADARSDAKSDGKKSWWKLHFSR